MIRRPLSKLAKELTAEEVHLFELSVEDWQLLALLSGWKTEETRIYRQYPMRSIFRATARIWQKLDFEGFVGLILKRDISLSARYKDW